MSYPNKTTDQLIHSRIIVFVFVFVLFFVFCFVLFFFEGNTRIIVGKLNYHNNLDFRTWFSYLKKEKKKKLCGICLLFVRRHTCYIPTLMYLVWTMEIALISFYMKINCSPSNYIRTRAPLKFIFKFSIINWIFIILTKF